MTGCFVFLTFRLNTNFCLWIFINCAAALDSSSISLVMITIRRFPLLTPVSLSEMINGAFDGITDESYIQVFVIILGPEESKTSFLLPLCISISHINALKCY